MVTILFRLFSTELYLPMSLLENEGIECEIKNEIVNRMMPMYTLGDGGAKLQVSEENYELAKNILMQAGYIVDHDASSTIDDVSHEASSFATPTTTNGRNTLLWALLLVSAALCVVYLLLR